MTFIQELHEARKARLARMSPKSVGIEVGLSTPNAPIVETAPAVVIENRMFIEAWKCLGGADDAIGTMRRIQRVVAAQYKVSVNDILSARRSAEVVRPRQIAMYLCKTLTTRSLPEIGRRFGGRDHTTVLHAVRKIGQLRKSDPSVDQEVSYLEARFQ